MTPVTVSRTASCAAAVVAPGSAALMMVVMA
jgi:hypothetical protein